MLDRFCISMSREINILKIMNISIVLVSSYEHAKALKHK
jgi:hypothetical protein